MNTNRPDPTEGQPRAQEELERRVAERTAELSSALGQLRELSAHLDAVREDERTRIAREIHDELGSPLVALKMDVDWLAARLGDHADLVAKCQGMGRLIDSAVDDVGRIMTELRPSILDYQGLWAALEWQAQEFIDSSGLRHDLQVHVCNGVQVPPGLEGERWSIAVFRIFQQILSNVASHAQATAMRVRLYVDGPQEPVLYLEVRDNGVGAQPGILEDRRHWGVMAMRERAARFGGRLKIDTAPAQGTAVFLTMPLPQASVDIPDAPK